MVSTPVFSIQFRRTILEAASLAMTDEGSLVEPRHVLLALLKAKNSVCYAIFSTIGVNTSEVTTLLAEIVADSSNVHVVEPGLPYALSTASKAAISVAVDEAGKMNEEFVGVEHLLLGLFTEPDDAISRLIHIFSLKPEQVRMAVLEIVG